MNSAAPTTAVTGSTASARSTRADRIAALLPVAGVYVAFCFVYAVEAWSRVTPWLFTDELELTQLSRSIAATGHAARRGEAHSPDSLYTVLTAPLWLIHNVSSAYAAIKYVDVFAMTSVVFPTYLLARLVVGRRWALFAAAGAAAIPSLAYSSYLVEETFAYPYAAWCFFLVAKAAVELRRSRRSYAWTAGAVVAVGLAAAVKGELVVMPLLLLLAACFWAWSSEAVRRHRARWSLADHAGFAVIVLGVVFVISGIATKQSQQWYVVTDIYKHRVLDMGGWAFGALAIGVGVVPFLAGLASLVPLPREEPSRELRAYRSVAVAGLIVFGTYASMKAAYLSTVFATRVEERNLIYIAPLLFVGTALVLERRRVQTAALAASAIFTGYLVGYAAYHSVGSPYEMGVQLYSDSLGFSILQQANRYLYLDVNQARVLMIGVFLLGLLLVSAHRAAPLASRTRLLGLVASATALAVVAWNLTGQVAASIGTISISRTQAKTLGKPYRWVDAETHGKPTLYLGAGETDQTAEWLLEFWNRSLARVSSIDRSVDGPGPAAPPSIAADGTLDWGQAATPYDYAVEDLPCINLAGQVRALHHYRAGGLIRTWALVGLNHPTQLRSMCTGLYADGWSGPDDSAYFRFSGGRGHWLKVTVSRTNWSGPSDPTGVHVALGRLFSKDGYPRRGRTLVRKSGSVDSGQATTFWLRVPTERFAVQVTIDKHFVPSQVDPSRYSDSRELGAQIRYALVSHPPRHAHTR